MTTHDRQMPPPNDWDALISYAPNGLTEKQWQQLKLLYQQLCSSNKQLNLTRLTSLPDFLTHHVLDSWQLCPLLEKIHPRTILDIGTGGGFPALILAITYPEIQVTGLDSVGKKLKAIQTMAEACEIKNIQCIVGRAEALARESGYREQFDVVTARAVAALPALLEYASGLIQPNGYFLAMKTQQAYQTEVVEASTLENELGLRLLEKYDYHLEGLLANHCILKYQKLLPLNEKYPRPTAQIQKKPLR